MDRALSVFGLTGGLASGKSTVAAYYSSLGLPMVSADTLAREVVAPGSPALREIIERFGPEVAPEGTLDRKRLGTLVFGDEAQRLELESITHPRIRSLFKQRIDALERQGEPLAGYEIPLLFEVGLQDELRPVVLVAAPEAIQVERAMARDGATRAAVEARLRAQLPVAKKTALADYVIDNRGTLEQLHAAAADALRLLCRDLGIDATRYRLPAP
jgi:dephospho-CoA kinase